MNIYGAINAAMSDIEPIAKDRKNEKQNFKFRGIDDIMNELQPVLVKHGIFVVPEVVNVIREQKQSNGGGVLLYSIVTMKYTFYATDGTNVSATVIGEGMDSGDKASNKAMAVAMKYALLQVFCIPTEDAKDPDAESPAIGAPQDNGNEFVTTKNALIDWLQVSPPVFNDEWTKYANERIAAKDIDGMKTCIETAKKLVAKKEQNK